MSLPPSAVPSKELSDTLATGYSASMNSGRRHLAMVTLALCSISAFSEITVIDANAGSQAVTA